MALKSGLQIGGRLLIANNMDQSLWFANEKQGAVISIYYTLLKQVLGFVVPCTGISKLWKNCQAKTILLRKLACKVKQPIIEHWPVTDRGNSLSISLWSTNFTPINVFKNLIIERLVNFYFLFCLAFSITFHMMEIFVFGYGKKLAQESIHLYQLK
jgi:hypothetical protein